jgi:precorrin-3B C17-methyltransferase
MAADMATLVVIGASATRSIDRGSDAIPFVYTPRSIRARC